MSPAKRIVLTAFAAMLLLSIAAGTAAALRSLQFNTREISLLSRALTFNGPASVICEVALNMTLNELTSAKTSGPVIGRVTPVVLRCGRETSFIVLNTPWNVRYASISGTLPDVTGITLIIENMQFNTRALFGECLVRSESSGLQRVTTEAGHTGTVGNLEGRPYVLRATAVRGFCTAGEVRLEGTFTPQNGLIAIRLV